MIKNVALKLSRYIVNKSDDCKVNRITQIADFKKINNCKKVFNKKILFVIPMMISGSGGLTSILRIAYRLEKKGFNITFASYEGGTIEKMIKASKSNLDGYNIRFIDYYEAKNLEYEYVIACNWQAVYYSKDIVGYKIYFTQDFEPYFYSYSDNYFLAKKAYELGFHIISLGKWNIEQIIKNCDKDIDIKMDFIEFPFESKEYVYEKKDFNEYEYKKEVKIAIYTKREKKRMPGLILSMVKKAKEILKDDGIELIPFYFGLNKKEKIDGAVNLGRVSKKELSNLYHECDFGMVASMTNISLVPYEMIGSGLPVIEFKDGTYSSFLGTNTALLIDFDAKELVSIIKKSMKNPKELKSMTESAYERIKQLSWDNTAEEFYRVLIKE